MERMAIFSGIFIIILIFLIVDFKPKGKYHAFVKIDF